MNPLNSDEVNNSKDNSQTIKKKKNKLDSKDKQQE